MAVRKIKAFVRDDRHLETSESLTGVNPGQEVELFIYPKEKSKRKNQPLIFTDHTFGKWWGGRMRREEIYHGDGR